MEIDKDVLGKLPANYQKPGDIVGENGRLKQLTKALVERAMEAELTTHLGYEKHDPVDYGSGNSRNGTSKKKLKGDFGEIDIAAPRDRIASFKPQIVPKGQMRFTGFDDKISTFRKSRVRCRTGSKHSTVLLFCGKHAFYKRLGNRKEDGEIRLHKLLDTTNPPETVGFPSPGTTSKNTAGQTSATEESSSVHLFNTLLSALRPCDRVSLP